MSDYNPPLDLRIYDAIQDAAISSGLARHALNERYAMAIVDRVMVVLKDYELDANSRPKTTNSSLRTNRLT